MKVEIFVPVSYYGPVDKAWPTPPRCYDPQIGMQSMEWGMQQCEAAFKAGFDSLNFAEHHYSVNQLSPSPIFYAGLLGQRLPDAHIGVLGSDLPLHNPVQLAEEYSMLDNLLAGRLTIGLLRGTPNEYMTYGTNPWDSKEAFKEGVRLFIRALTEPEPFGWEGRYYRHRNVSIWPQPLQRPHPRILLSGNSPDSARFAGEMHCDLGFSFMPAEKCAENLEHYRAGAADAGWEPTADNVLYRQFCFVHEDESEAHKASADLGGLFAGGSMDMMMTMGMIGAAMNGVPEGCADRSVEGARDVVLARLVRHAGASPRGDRSDPLGRRHGPRRVHRRRHAEDAAPGGGRVASADGRDDGSGTARRSLLVGGRLMAGEKLVEKSVEADGFTIRYYEEGEGDPVVVLHGAGGPVAVGRARPAVGAEPHPAVRAARVGVSSRTTAASHSPISRTPSSRRWMRSASSARMSWARLLVVRLRCTSLSTIPSGSRRWCSSRRPPSASAACRPRASRPSRW